ADRLRRGDDRRLARLGLDLGDPTAHARGDDGRSGSVERRDGEERREVSVAGAAPLEGEEGGLDDGTLRRAEVLRRAAEETRRFRAIPVPREEVVGPQPVVRA